MSRTVTGSCWSSSVSLPKRREAFRCESEDTGIIDPCFAGEDNMLVCASSPWSRTVALRLTEPLPEPTPDPSGGESTDGTPWAVELADGKRCSLTQGATSAIAGKRLNYGCGQSGPQLWGDPDRSNPRWRIFQGREGQSSLTQTEIAVAWY